LPPDDLTVELRDVLLAALQRPLTQPEVLEMLALRLAQALRHHFAGQYLYFGSGRLATRHSGRASSIREDYRNQHGRLVRDLARRYGCSVQNVYALARAKKKSGLMTGQYGVAFGPDFSADEG
jgi:Mor family transcriptional regulator